MKNAKVSELKAHLSRYLSEVRRGETVIVFDRNTPIARLLPYEDQFDEFRIEKPRRPPRALKKIRRIRLRKKVDIVKVLREMRE